MSLTVIEESRAEAPGGQNATAPATLMMNKSEASASHTKPIAELANELFREPVQIDAGQSAAYDDARTEWLGLSALWP